VLDYRPNTCAYCKSDTWCESRANGKPQCRACKVERFFERYLYPPLGFVLMDWQRTFLRNVYGTVDPSNGRRQYRKAYRAIAKKNGKSFLCGGLPIYALVADETEEFPEIYGAAASVSQATLVYRAACKLIRKNPDLFENKLKILQSTLRIVRRDGRGFYQVVSADGDVNDGIEPSLSILDELHRWKTKPAEANYAVLTSGNISRSEPLVIEITTAGNQFESPLWFLEHQHAQELVDGISHSDTFYAEIDAADAKRIQSEPEYWKSRGARVAANPSHEDNGGFLKDERIEEHMLEAIAQPAKYYNYLRLHLNIPIGSSDNPAIELPVWKEGTGPEDISKWPEYDAEYLALKWKLKNRPCFPGIDIAWTTDFNALVFPFPPFQGDPNWYLLPFFWIPEDRVPILERQTRQPLRDWIKRKFLIATPRRDEIPEAMKQKLLWGAERFDVREIGYDPWNCKDLANQLHNQGFQPIEVRQGPPSLSAPTKKLLELVVNRRLIHGNHPVLTWNASCLSLEISNDNCKPAKPLRDTAAKRIDGISATVTGMNRALLAITVPSAYSDPSQIVI